MTSNNKSVKSSTLKNDVDYTLYKYFDIQNKWIIYQGYLNYRSIRIKFFNVSQFAIYYVVLARIPIENDKEIMIIYLYKNQKEKLFNFFQLNEYEKISNQCSKPIKSKYYLFELVRKNQNGIEIFGANDVNEREKWIEHISQAINWTKQNLISIDLPIIHQDSGQSWRGDSQNMEHIDLDACSNYEPFIQKQYLSLPRSNCTFLVPHRPPPPIPTGKHLKSNENKPTELQKCHNDGSSQPTENIYLEAKEIPQCLIKEEVKSEIFQSNLQVKTEESEKNLSISLEDKPFTWDDIFYSNENDDHADVLNNICQIGAFLVRPQLKKHNFNDHNYTLSIYTFESIIKYKILNLPNGKYGLVTDCNQPNFDNIPDLCQYYTNHQLPRSTLRENITKGPVENLYLKLPYMYYLQQSNKL